jgi:hypothetical protein
MEYPPKIFARAAWAGGLSDVSQISEHWRLARAAYADLRHLGMPRTNLLVEGPEAVVSNLIGLLQRHLDAPIAGWYPGQRLALPVTGQGGTLILHEAGALPFDDQWRLLDWLEQSNGETRILTTTSVSLLSRVQKGTFIETLFYRLNTVCVDATA